MNDHSKRPVEQLAIEARAPQQAVQEYLDALLQEATEAVAREPTPAVVEVRLPKVTSVPPVTPKSDSEPERVEQPTLAAESVATSKAANSPETQGWVDGRPEWAQQRFECLLFRVAGLTLAVPLVELGGVLTLNDDLTPLFGQPDWFLGLLPCRGEGTIKTLDTARWVMPEKYDPASREGLKFVIRIEGSDWGMACHEVQDAITLEPEQVRWRTDRSRRPWLAGTVIEHMCAIMDVSALAQLIQAQQPKTAPRGGAVL